MSARLVPRTPITNTLVELNKVLAMMDQVRARRERLEAIQREISRLTDSVDGKYDRYVLKMLNRWWERFDEDSNVPDRKAIEAIAGLSLRESREGRLSVTSGHPTACAVLLEGASRKT